MKHLLESVLDGSASPEQRRELIARIVENTVPVALAEETARLAEPATSAGL